MGLSDSIMSLLEQGLKELVILDISFIPKLLMIFGVIYLFNVIMKTGGSLLNFVVYVIAFIKWVAYKILKKDI